MRCRVAAHSAIHVLLRTIVGIQILGSGVLQKVTIAMLTEQAVLRAASDESLATMTRIEGAYFRLLHLLLGETAPVPRVDVGKALSLQSNFRMPAFGHTHGEPTRSTLGL